MPDDNTQESAPSFDTLKVLVAAGQSQVRADDGRRENRSGIAGRRAPVEGATDPNSPKFNRQKAGSSQLKELNEILQATGEDGLQDLHNARQPNLTIQAEKPEHRALLYMKAQGGSNREIAIATGYTEAWLSQLFRQPWAQRRLLDILNEAGTDAVSSLIRSAAADSVITLIALRDDHEVPASVRLNSAKDLLDRFLGKPTQSVNVNQLVTQGNGSAQSVEELDAEMAKLKQEEANLTGRGIN